MASAPPSDPSWPGRLACLDLVLVLSLVATGAGAQPLATLPARPEEIEFEPLVYVPPLAADHRHLLADGTVVYLAPSHEFPLVNLAITFKGGSSLDPADLPGLAAMTARLVREGGTATMGPAGR